jgi:Sec-independent protein translocase protein TatA
MLRSMTGALVILLIILVLWGASRVMARMQKP